MKFEGLLPLGSVVRLIDGEHRLMITGYGQRLDGQNDVNDYVSCLWPEGHQRPDECIVFNGDQIQDVYFLGYQTDGQQLFMARMEAALNEYRNQQEKK